MFESVKALLNRNDNHRADRQALEAEAKQFRLPSETLPKVLKYVFFGGLALLNFRLFNKTVPGIWGVRASFIF
jgi:hypothetical protein